MLESNRLRIDLNDGCHAVDYRIQNGNVESRTLETGCETNDESEDQWRRLTADQLSSHVMADTAVARWLRGRMGTRRLIRACNQESFPGNDAPTWPDQTTV